VRQPDAVIGRVAIPPEYAQWNEYWGAPYGHPVSAPIPLRQRIAEPDPAYGPFAFQANSGTRTFEYPWAYFATGATAGMRVLEAGGGMSGLQFVFALEGCTVVNADPCIDTDTGIAAAANAWQVTPQVHDRLNALFGTDVRLVRARVQDAGLEPESFDRALCLSVVEHLDGAEARGMVETIARSLVPGGIFVTSVDLFLDLRPFGVMTRNCYGTNVDVHGLVGDIGLDLVHGDPRELLGFPAFDRDRVVRALPELLIAPGYPCLTQTLVLRKPD
jgi:SAM-dependent methyltransferase